MPPIKGSITLDEVSLTYHERQEVPVLQNVILKAREGECVMIVGSFSSGKSIATFPQRLTGAQIEKANDRGK